MENHERIAGDGEFDLPKETIQRIQSFFDGKEAAQTTLLSQLWRSAWSTRPNLDFDLDHFHQSNGLQTVEEFLGNAKKTMQRYDDLNLNIETFRLHIENELFFKEKRDSHYLSLANELMVKAMKLGAIDLDINLGKQSSFVLPDSVFGSQTLTRLSLSGVFTVDLVRLTCFELKSLSLINVNVNENGDLFKDLLSRFPLLGRLELKGIRFPNDKYGVIEVKLKLEHDECHHKLEYFRLQDLYVDTNMIISSNFPFLKELVIRDCFGLRNIRICSESLERINIKRSFFSTWDITNRWDTDLYVPNIRKMKLEGYGWSRLTLKTTCTEWESDIRIRYLGLFPTPEWFISLNKVLYQLSLSRVCLTLSVDWPNDDWNGLVRVAGLPTPPPVVESLMLVGANIVNAAFLDKLFLICRPKLIALTSHLPIPSDDPTFKKNVGAY